MAKPHNQINSKSDFSPSPSTNRILHLDIFRGFAILGIFMVNILVMNVSFVYRQDWLIENASWVNEKAYWFLEMFFFSKFFPIFSFLFGIGVALQIRSLKAKKVSSTPFLLRRFFALFVFGIAHILFIWSGDILHLYALFGFVLMIMYRATPRVILLSAIVLFFFPYFDEIYQYSCDFFSVNPASALSNLTRENIVDLKLNGSYYSGIKLRLVEYSFMVPFLISLIIPIALTMSILGLYVVKKGIVDRIESFARKIRFPFLITLIVFLVYRFTLIYWLLPSFKIEHGSLLSFGLWTLYFFSEIMISFGYLWIIVYLLRSNLGKKLLSPLQYVGRMAFTNYILQSIIGYLIMRTFGYYETFSPAECILIVLVVFACQIPLSWYWLQHFKFGPLEWIWRCISYWKLLPLRK